MAFGQNKAPNKDRFVSHGRPDGCALYLVESVPKIFPRGESATIRNNPKSSARSAKAFLDSVHMGADLNVGELHRAKGRKRGLRFKDILPVGFWKCSEDESN